MARFIRILAAMARKRTRKRTGKTPGKNADFAPKCARGLTARPWPVSYGPNFWHFGRLGNADDGSIYFSGTGFPSGRHGQGPGGRVSGGQGRVRRGRCSAVRKADRDHLGGAFRDPSA